MAVYVFEETKVSNIAIFNRDFRDGLPLTCIQPFSIGTIERVSQCVNTCKSSRKSAMQPFSIGTFEMGYYWRIYSTFLLGLLRGCPSARTHVNHLKSQLYSHLPSWPSRWVTSSLYTAIFHRDFWDGLPMTYIQSFSIGTFERVSQCANTCTSSRKFWIWCKRNLYFNVPKRRLLIWKRSLMFYRVAKTHRIP